PETFAAFTNDHAACYMATRAQLASAIASGGFLVPPHDERYDMLCAAATDVYTQCGLRRLVCITRLRDFLLPHLPNKYIGRFGVKIETGDAQVEALRSMDANGAWRGSLFDVETRLPFGIWSKNLYETPDAQIMDVIPSQARRVLSVASGWGATEAALKDAGF